MEAAVAEKVLVGAAVAAGAGAVGQPGSVAAIPGDGDSVAAAANAGSEAVAAVGKRAEAMDEIACSIDNPESCEACGS
jgi:hypothetical protein